MSYSPAPWTTDKADHDQPYLPIKIKSGKHHTICTIWIDDAPVRDFNNEQEANARLILAAPELLNLLIEARDKGLIYWEPNTSRGHERKADMLARMDRAIAKAEGRS